MTQNEAVLRHLLDNGNITSLEAMNKYGIMRLGARVYDLKKQGYPIKTYLPGREITERREHGVCGVSNGASRRSAEEMESMSARYCKRKGCSANEGTPCESASVCAYWEWDIAREKGDKPQESKLTPKEDEEQKEFAAWLDETGLLWYHTPNERRASVTELVNLTAQGMKKGVPDNFIAEPRGKYHGRISS